MNGKDELQQPVSDEQTGTATEPATTELNAEQSTSTNDEALNDAFADEEEDDE